MRAANYLLHQFNICGAPVLKALLTVDYKFISSVYPWNSLKDAE
jgi:hypothetical protein